MSERLSMRKVREVLRLKYEAGRSHAEIAASIGIGETTVGDYVSRARRAGLDWSAAREHTEAELEAKLFRDVGRNEPPARVAIDFTCPSRAGTADGHAADAVGRVPGRGRRSGAAQALRVQPLLRPVRAMEGDAGPGDAPGASRRREGLHRLLRQEAAHRRARDGRGPRRSSSSSP